MSAVEPTDLTRDIAGDVMDALPAAIYTTDAEGRLTSFNKACVSFSGRIPELGTDRWCVTWRLFWPNGDPMPFDECPMAVALQEGRVIRGAEAIAERPDGSRIWFAAHPTPLFNEAGRLIGGVNMLVDITERKEGELSLARSAREQGALYRFTDSLQRAATEAEINDAALDAILGGLDSDRAAILMLDGDEVMRFVAWRGLSDEYRAAVEGHSPWRPDDLDPHPIAIPSAAEASDLDDRLKRVIADEGISAIAFIPLMSSGRLVGKFMVYYDAPHAFDAAELDLELAIARQLSFALARLRAEHDRRETSDALVDADRRKDEFLAILAHELRNPLGPIHSALPLIDRSLASGEHPGRWLAMVERQTMRLRRLVDDLMDVSRITHGHIDLRNERVDLVALVNRAADTHADDAAEARLAVERHVAEEPVFVEGDPIRLEQVVTNLLSNAIKYTEPGGTITVGVAPQDGVAQITVRDTGIGIDPAFRRRMFTLFEQAERTLDRSNGGLGIGLTLARQLVMLHGGTIDCTSEGPGRGSLFTVRLPIRERGKSGASAGGSGGAVSADARRIAHRVLIVDDNSDYAEVLNEVVRQLGHEVMVAHDGKRAVALAETFVPDVVLLDIGLPGLSGYDVAHRLRATPGTHAALIVAISGYGQPADRELSTRAGIDAHMIKPIDLGALEEMIGSTNGW